MKKLILYVLFFVTVNHTQAQMGFPVSFDNSATNSQAFRTSMSQQTLPNYSNSTLIARADSIKAACGGCGPDVYFGKGMAQSTNLKSSAHYYNANINNGKLWIYKMSSPTALGLMVYFNKFILPPEGFLYVYNADRSIVYGPYTSLNTPDDTTKAVQFGTPLIASSEIYLEYFEPSIAAFAGHIEINNTIHAFNSLASGGQFGKGASCNVDFACQAGWEGVANSVGIITVYNEEKGFIGFCSGTLLNNTAEDGEGYFLTAAHCNPLFVSNPNILNWDPSTWQIYFDYQQTTCNSVTNFINFHKIIFGADVLSADALNPSNNFAINSDYLLLRLKEPKESRKYMKLCYAGWESKDLAGTINAAAGYISIHHPRGDYKKITSGINLRNSSSMLGWSPTNYFALDLTGGALENASSGSGLFDGFNKRLVATHTGRSYFGTYDPCVYSTYYPVFGKFSRHWTLGNFAPHLDPLGLINNTTNTALNGKCFLPSGEIPSYIEGGSVTTVNSSGPSVNFRDGLRLQGQSGTPILCYGGLMGNPSNYYHLLTISPLVVNGGFVLRNYQKESPCGFFGSNLNGYDDEGCFAVKRVLGVPTKCACYYESYKMSIEELDYNLTSQGVVYSDDVDWKVPNNNDFNVRASLNFPAAAINYIQPGKYYKVNVEKTNTGYDYGSINFFSLPQNLVITNKTITQNIYSQIDIQLNDAFIDNQVDIGAGTDVVIKKETTIKSGRIFNQTISCQSYYRPSSDNSASDDETENNAKNFNTTKTEFKNKVYPNPNNGNFIYELNYNVGGYLVLRNILGAEIIKENVMSFESNKALALTNIENGVYFLSYYDRYDNIVESQKLIVNK